MSQLLIPLLIITPLVIILLPSKNSTERAQKIRNFKEMSGNIVGTNATPNAVIDLDLKTKINSFVKNNICRNCYIQQYEVVNSDLDSDNKIIDLKIKVIIVKKTKQSWNDTTAVLLMTAKITPNGIKVKSIRTGPTGDKIIPQNSNKNCEYNLDPNINDDKKRFDFLQ
jgi:hypothetical protein